LTHEPKNYELPHHLQRIYDSAEFAEAAKHVGKEVEAFRTAVMNELKRVSQEVRDQELKEYEAALGEKALYHAVEKFRDDLRLELKESGRQGSRRRTCHA